MDGNRLFKDVKAYHAAVKGGFTECTGNRSHVGWWEKRKQNPSVVNRENKILQWNQQIQLYVTHEPQAVVRFVVRKPALLWPSLASPKHNTAKTHSFILVAGCGSILRICLSPSKFAMSSWSHARDVQAPFADATRHLWVRLVWCGGTSCHHWGEFRGHLQYIGIDLNFHSLTARVFGLMKLLGKKS